MSKYNNGEWLKVDKFRSLIKRIIMMIRLGKQISQFKVDDEIIFLYEHNNDYLITNTQIYQRGQFGFYKQVNISRKRVRIFIIPKVDTFPTSKDFDTFFNKIPSYFIKEIHGLLR